MAGHASGTGTREYGTVIALAAAIPMLTLIAVNGRWPAATLWRGSLGDSQILLGTIGVICGFITCAALPRLPPLTHIIIAVLLTAAAYGAVQGWTQYAAAAPGRNARAHAAAAG